MGNFYVNFTVRGSAHGAVAKSLRTRKRKAYVSPTAKGVTVVFDERADTQDEAEILQLGRQLSKDLKSTVFAILNHDDDILCYWLFKSGKIVDQYDSCPGYFDDSDTTPSGGDARKLCAAFGVAGKEDEVDAILRHEDYIFALDRHKELAALLEQPWSYVCTGYNHVSQGLLAEGVRPTDMLRVG